MSQPCPLEMFGPTSKLRSTLHLRYLIVIEVSLGLPFFRLPKVTFSTTTTSKYNTNKFYSTCRTDCSFYSLFNMQH